MRPILIFLVAVSCWAQQSNTAGRNQNYLNANIQRGTSVPTSCLYNQLYVKTDTGVLYACVLGSFVAQSGGSTGTPTVTVASGTKALATAEIASGACTDAQTASATGTAATDVIIFTPNADITAVTGYAPVTTGGLAIYAWPSENLVSFKVCNPTSAAITPGAAVTLNFRVVR